MNKRLLGISLLLISCTAFSQRFSKAYHDVNECPNPFVVSINGDIYFTTQSLDLQNFSDNYLYKHNSSGTLAFRSTVFNYIATRGFESLDHKLVTLGYKNFNCDVPTPVQNNFLTKIDANGNVVFNSTYTVTNGDSPRACIQYVDSGYFTFTNNLLIRHDKNGLAVSTVTLNINGISSALLLPNNNILVSAFNSNITSLVELSSNGTVISSMPYPVMLSKLSFYGTQKIIGRGTDGKFHKFSSALNHISSSVNTGIIISNNFVCQQDSLYCLYVSSAGVPHYMVMDTAFNTLSSFPTTTNKLSQDAICMSNNKVAIVSTGMLPVAGPMTINHFFASINVIDKNSGNTFKSDLALKAVIADSMYTQCNTIPPGSAYVCNTYLRPKVKIKNTGITPIYSFKLNCFEYPAVACGHRFYQEKFTGLNIAPGDSLIVTATKFALKNMGPVTAPFNVEYCFYVTLPNDETDKTVEDNEQCKTIHFLISGLSNHAANTTLAEIYPNPFNRSLIIKANTMISEIRLRNCLGMLVSESSVNAESAELALQDLSPGIYFIEAETEKGTIVKKIMKE